MRIEVNEEEAVYLLNSQKDEISSLKVKIDDLVQDRHTLILQREEAWQAYYRAEKGELVRLRERDQARAVARRLYHDWDARTVRSLQEIAEENSWILERENFV